jgi:hypothetical protein
VDRFGVAVALARRAALHADLARFCTRCLTVSSSTSRTSGDMNGAGHLTLARSSPSTSSSSDLPEM